ncbi:Ubiquinone/menaquinone biosynthesis C-methyltransferase UbiE [termite gut metagenome]|uniref:Ubiquinone/menaquinone biosynthesis C-methyltransferase UbiE n=1 Tax=termite gut metagenome TaxID=433724 RepID=A0A5J4Q5H0_9ZZZZ
MDAKTAIEFFNKMAPEWDRMQNPVYLARIGGHFVNINIKPGAKVADIGCGSGVLYPYIQNYKPSEIVCFDISPQMLLELKKKYPAAHTVQGNFEAFDCKKEYFDCILIFNTFPHFKHQAGAVKKVFEMLVGGGQFVIFHSLTREELARAHGEGKDITRDILPSQSELKNMFLKAGFKNKNIVLQEDENGCFFSATK